MLFQHFENNITADDNSNPRHRAPDFTFGANINTPQQTIQRRWQFKDDFAFRKSRMGRRPRLQGRRRDRQVALRRVLHSRRCTAFFNFVDPLPGNARRLPELASPTRSPDRPARTRPTTTGRTSAIYFQDDFHPTSRLTLNLGLRYELQSGPYSNDFQTPVLDGPGPPGFNNTAHARQEQLRAAPRVRLRRAGVTARPSSAAGTASTTTRSSRTSRCTNAGPTSGRR